MNGENKKLIRRFNRSAAGAYDLHASVQRDMAAMLMEALGIRLFKEEDDKLSMLEIGCGTGHLTRLLAGKWPNAEIVALDIASEMIAAAEQRMRSTSSKAQVSFLHHDVETWASHAESSSFDLIVSSACFQWLRHPGNTLKELRRMLSPGGTLAFATFGPDTFRELHASFDEAYSRRGLKPQRHGLTFQTPEQWKASLLEAGFSMKREWRSHRIETYDSVAGFLHAVKALGASSSEAAAAGGLGNRRLFADMFQTYGAAFGTPEGVAATYDLLLFQAVAGDPSQV